MSRGAVAIYSGFVPTSFPIEGDGNDLYDALLDAIQTYESNSTTAWETYDTIDTRDKVLKSKGDRTLAGGAGDAALYARLTWSEAANVLYIAGLQDFNTVTDTAVRGTDPNAGLSVSDGDVNGDTDWYVIMNEYEVHILLLWGSTTYYCTFGSPIRSHVPPAHRGIAFTTADATAAGGANVVISIDRDISSTIQVGSNVWIYQLTPSGTTPVYSATVEVLNVEAVSSTTITLKIASNKKSGSIVGFDPCPMLVTDGVPGVSGATIWTNAGDGTAGYTFTAGSRLARTAVDPANAAPLPNGFALAATVELADSTNPTRGVRGTFQHIRAFALASPPSAGQLKKARINLDDSRIYYTTTALTTTGFYLGFGPGAPP